MYSGFCKSLHNKKCNHHSFVTAKGFDMGTSLIYFVGILIVAEMNMCSASQCHTKFGWYDKETFNIQTCSFCYHFLFHGREYMAHLPSNCLISRLPSGNKYGVKSIVCPDNGNSTAMDMVCETLSDGQCEMWRSCCRASRDCCTRQIQAGAAANNYSSCHATWDGFVCWDAAMPGTKNYASCPKYLQYSIPTRSAVKTCLANGTWQMRGPPFLEWTDYTPCINMEDLRITIYIRLGCQIASLLCLIPAVIIFLSYKALLSQHRIRIHVNFFISFIANGICSLLWNITITYEKITSDHVTDTHLYRNTVECRLLSFLKLYFASTTFVWMFCEGLYLYRLIGNAYSPPKKLLWFYLLGWGCPLIYSSVYAIVRIIIADEHCWTKNIGHFQWILYGPNLFCLAANIFFLCNILWILLTQLQTHPNEPSHFRKALKATFVLIPLFGVQLVVTVYRPEADASGYLYYERFGAIVTDSQGMFVALIFCLCNLEVLTLMKHSVRRRRDTLDLGSKKGHSAISLHNINHSFTTRLHASMSKKDSTPNKGLISCMNPKTHSDATPV